MIFKKKTSSHFIFLVASFMVNSQFLCKFCLASNTRQEIESQPQYHEKIKEHSDAISRELEVWENSQTQLQYNPLPIISEHIREIEKIADISYKKIQEETESLNERYLAIKARRLARGNTQSTNLSHI